MLVGRLSVRPMVAHKCQPSFKDQAHHTTFLVVTPHHMLKCIVAWLSLISYGGSNSSQSGALWGVFFLLGMSPPLPYGSRNVANERVAWEDRVDLLQVSSVQFMYCEQALTFRLVVRSLIGAFTTRHPLRRCVCKASSRLKSQSTQWPSATSSSTVCNNLECKIMVFSSFKRFKMSPFSCDLRVSMCTFSLALFHHFQNCF